MTSEWHRDGFTVSTDKARLDVELIHRFLAATYWARGIPAAVVRRAIDHSLCFGLYENAQDGERQVGFARVITDYATFAYLSDVFVLEAYRGRGLGDWLVATILAHPDLPLPEARLHRPRQPRALHGDRRPRSLRARQIQRGVDKAPSGKPPSPLGARGSPRVWNPNGSEARRG